MHLDGSSRRDPDLRSRDDRSVFHQASFCFTFSFIGENRMTLPAGSIKCEEIGRTLAFPADFAILISGKPQSRDSIYPLQSRKVTGNLSRRAFLFFHKQPNEQTGQRLPLPMTIFARSV